MKDYLENTNYVITGNISDNCPWQISCDVGQYWDGRQGYQQCYECGTGYDIGPQFISNVYGGPNLPTSLQVNLKLRSCTPKLYDISLMSGLNDSWNVPDASEYKSYSIQYKYDAGFGMQNKEFYNDTISHLNVLQPNKAYLEFIGYYTKEQNASDAEQVFNSTGATQGNFGNNHELFTTDGTTAVLYAHYEIHPINIWYAKDRGQVGASAEHSFTVEDGTNSNNRKVRSVDSAWFKEHDGEMFSHYDCWDIDTGGKCAGKSTYKPNDVLEFSSSLNRVLIPVYTDCPAGYYCKNNEQKACPGGSTSAARSSEIGNCYIAGGNSGTKFIDGAGNSFVLPAGKIIYYF